MKSNTNGKKKKGFYMALYAGVGAAVVLAVVLTFTNFTILPNQLTQQTEDYSGAYEEEAAAVGADTVQPYMEAHQDALFRPRVPEPDPPRPPTREAPSRDASPTQETPGTAPEARGPVAPAAPRPQPPRAQPAASPEPPAETPRAEVFEPFTEEANMIWPVEGDIAMVFSQDRLIYNPTLDQWRTNDDLRIAAQEGTPVRAAAPGRVIEIGNDRVYGNFVRIDNGNGWETIFGQLMDGVLVAEGDIVQEGQVIGGIGQPSIFSVLNGHHLSMRVLQNDELVDPKVVLAALE